ncbi:MAG: hypothetical protein ABI349_02320 [Casimicrobiaceae bacterium]
MIKFKAVALGSLVGVALVFAPLSSAFADQRFHGGHWGHGYGYGAWPVIGLAVAVVGTAAAIVTAPFAIASTVANGLYYGPVPSYAAAPVRYYDAPPPAYYAPPARAYYSPPTAQVYYGAPVAPAYHGPSARTYYDTRRAYYAPRPVQYGQPPDYYGPRSSIPRDYYEQQR